MRKLNILSEINKINKKSIFMVCFFMLSFYYFYNIITKNIGLVDFNPYYYATRAFWEGEWAIIYTPEYYELNTNGIYFVYFPSFLLINFPSAFLPIDSAKYMFAIINYGSALATVYFMYQIGEKIFGENRYKTNILVIMYSLYIQHWWNVRICQRGDLGAFFLVLIIYRQLYYKNRKDIITHFSFVFLCSIFPYLILLYGIFILRNFNIQVLAISGILFILLNLPLLFYYDRFYNLIMTWNTQREGFTDLGNLYAHEYNLLGILNALFHIPYFTEIVIGLLFLIFGLVFYLNQNKDFINVVRDLSLSFLFVNGLLHGLHLLAFYPFILLYVLSQKDALTLDIIPICNLLGILMIMFPIPSLFLLKVGLGEYIWAKRVLGYFLFFPSIFQNLSQIFNRKKIY